VITRHSVGDQKQILAASDKTTFQKAAANNRYNTNQAMLDAEQLIQSCRFT
jgi:hypothetical protein